MTPLPTIEGGFRLIVADPPTDFRAGKKGRPQHYRRMTDHEIAAPRGRDWILAAWARRKIALGADRACRRLATYAGVAA